MYSMGLSLAALVAFMVLALKSIKKPIEKFLLADI